MEDKCSFKYYEVHCYGDNDSECYLVTTNESVARMFARSQIWSTDDGTCDFRFHSVHFDEIESYERLVL